MNIAAYCRVSTDKEDQLNSLEAQKEFFSEYTKRTGDNLVRLYADEGISGTKIKNRKEFLRMMADAEHGLFDMVVVKDISRFARNTVDLLQNVRKLKALGIETQFLTANMTSMGNSEFVLTIFGALAQEESANTSKRVKFGKKMNAEKGRVPNIVYGYDKTIGDYFNLAINEEEAAVVRQIYQWYIKDGYGAAKISIFLNERGLRTKRNCQWSQNGVCRILTNELYTGKIINGKQEVTDFLTGQRTDKDASEWMVVDRPDLRIIDPETFERAQQIMKSRGKAFKVDKERQSNKYLFSTLIKCKECGWSFRRTVRTYKNTYVRWVCSGHNGRGADNCPNAVTVDEDELIEVLQEYFTGLLKAKKNVIRYVVGEFQRVYKAKDENLNYEKELTAQLAKLQKTRQKYMDMYADDLISREELNDKIGGMRKEIERLENELKMVSYHLTKGEQLESVLQQTFKEIEDITDVRQMTNAQLKRIIQKIEVDKDGNVDIYLRLLGDLGLDETVLIRNDETQGRFPTAEISGQRPLSRRETRPGRQQGPAAHTGRACHQEKIRGNEIDEKRGCCALQQPLPLLGKCASFPGAFLHLSFQHGLGIQSRPVPAHLQVQVGFFRGFKGHRRHHADLLPHGNHLPWLHQEILSHAAVGKQIVPVFDEHHVAQHAVGVGLLHQPVGAGQHRLFILGSHIQPRVDAPVLHGFRIDRGSGAVGFGGLPALQGPDHLVADLIQGSGGGHLVLCLSGLRRALRGGRLLRLLAHLAGCLFRRSRGGPGRLRVVLVYPGVFPILLGDSSLLLRGTLRLGVCFLALAHLFFLLFCQRGRLRRFQIAVHRVIRAPGGNANCGQAHGQRHIKPAFGGFSFCKSLLVHASHSFRIRIRYWYSGLSSFRLYKHRQNRTFSFCDPEYFLRKQNHSKTKGSARGRTLLTWPAPHLANPFFPFSHPFLQRGRSWQKLRSSFAEQALSRLF